MKKILLALLLCCSQAFGSQISAGDSITGPGTAATSGNSYVSLLSTTLGVPITNYGVSGDQAADQAVRTYGVNLAAGDKATLMVGTNDQFLYGTSTYKQGLFKSFHTSIFANIALPSKVNGNSSGMTYTGSWTTSQPTWARGKWSFTAGNTATATVSGTAVYVGVIRQDDISGNAINGTADVYVDSVKVGSITTAGTGMTTQNGNAYAPAAFRFGGLSAGSHTVQIVVTSAIPDYRGLMYVEYIAGSDQSSKPSVYVSTIPKYSTAAYTTIGGSAANMATYNGIVTTNVSNAIADGLAVYQVDASAVVNQTSDLSSDGVHPVNSGHSKIFNAFFSAMTGGITYTPFSLFKGSNNSWYVDDGSGKVPFVYP